MDLIKETYNILLHHLGEDTPRGRKISAKYDELRADLSKLVGFGIVSGNLQGHRELMSRLKTEARAWDDRYAQEFRQMREVVEKRRPVSREIKRNED